ncbi:alpha/beta hydrolase family esterase [Leptospira kobayashii]|uniref:alpha/beta hydrolase family esterase n=1 Tax=Leptospira kobayashii TaxID=1917830 RepID=UPI001FA7B68C|nr:PHB depolymerase family esterase [Leptospira kobayashii]
MFTFFSCKTLPKFIPVQNHKSSQIISNGIERSFRYLLPGEYKKNSLPLIFVLHGGGGSSEAMIYLTRLSEKVDQDRFIVVYPEGFANRWNDGRGIKHSITDQKNTEDVLFFRDMVTYFKKNYQIDESRIHVVGLSNGGFMAQRLACEAPDIFASSFSVAATTSKFLSQNCTLNGPLSIGFIFGKKDDIIPYNGGTIYIPKNPSNDKDRIGAGESISFQDSLKFWSEKLQCTSENKRYIQGLKPKINKDIIRYDYESANSSLKLRAFLLENGGHIWPHGFFYHNDKKYGYLSEDLDASSAVLDFFKETPKTNYLGGN